MDLLFEVYKAIPAISINPRDILCCINGKFVESKGAANRWERPQTEYHLSTVLSCHIYTTDIVLLTMDQQFNSRYCTLLLDDIVNILPRIE